MINGAFGFGFVGAINQDIARQPIKLTKQWHPRETFLTDGDHFWRYRFRNGKQIPVILVVSNINVLTTLIDIGRSAVFKLNTEHFRHRRKLLTKGINMLRVTWTEQTVTAAKHKHIDSEHCHCQDSQ
ncbi:Uncharacterised protein [Vibrio cholerae]|uniref:Uncharacterized protein n=1 Tax=Vibrio cholerae TaxID=666 RepID=A0A655RPT4_VIBCL|nr:Uncharacterised protein [Vibrio cholerae]CSB04008.1 Uncharacterised protein [Vibrio cholerae]CSB05962.1 Uncharacterised protein [Vibrio cholerae]